MSLQKIGISFNKGQECQVVFKTLNIEHVRLWNIIANRKTSLNLFDLCKKEITKTFDLTCIFRVKNFKTNFDIENYPFKIKIL